MRTGFIVKLVIALLFFVALMPRACAQAMLPHRKAQTATAASSDFPAPISYWTLDESGGVRMDSEPSGTPQNLIESLAVSSAVGIITNSATFATTRYLYHDDSSELSVGSSDFTVSLWFYANSFGTEMALVDKWEDPTNHEWYFRRYNGNYEFFATTNAIAGDYTSYTIPSETTGVWHFAVIWRETVAPGVVTINLQIDNGAISSITRGFNAPTDTTAKFQIGTYALLSSTFWNGRIDEVGFWKVSLNSTQRAYLYNSGAGQRPPGLSYPTPYILTNLVAYWTMDEASGSRSDSTSNAQTLTDNNTVGSTTGKISNAALFVRASTEYLSRVDGTVLSMGDIDFTIGMWAYLTTKPGAMSILGKWGAGSLEYLIYYDNTGDRLYFLVSDNGSNVNLIAANALGSPATGTWYYIVAWHDSVSNLIGIKVNDGTANTASHTTGVFDGTSSFGVGDQIPDAGNAFNGRVDEAGIWKRLLYPGEMTYLYNSGTGRTYPFN